MKKFITILAVLLVFGLIMIPSVGVSHECGDQKCNYEVTSQDVGKKKGEESWGALDELVIEKLAVESGREPRPFIEMEGDLIILAFSLVSGIAGFVIGYFTRKLFFEKGN